MEIIQGTRTIPKPPDPALVEAFTEAQIRAQQARNELDRRDQISNSLQVNRTQAYAVDIPANVDRNIVNAMHDQVQQQLELKIAEARLELARLALIRDTNVH